MLKPFDIQHRYVYNFFLFIIFSAHHLKCFLELAFDRWVRLVYFVLKKWGKGCAKLFSYYDSISVCHECKGNMKIMSCC